MLFFYLGLAAIASCVLHGVSFDWFANNQTNNIHTITQLWLDDPIEKAFLINSDQDCPDNTKEEQINYNYAGEDGLCYCQPTDSYAYEDTKDRYLTATPPPPNYYLKYCGQLTCSAGYDKKQYMNGIASENLNTFFKNKSNNQNQKLCVSRIEGYSFAKKAPLDRECASDEIYCVWINNKQTFDIDHGYCIPKDRECYASGVALTGFALTQTDPQLPMVGFQIGLLASNQYNIVDYFQTNEKDLLDLNNVEYPSAFSNQFSQVFFFQNQFMPRVKARCREQLQQTLASYIGPDGALKVSLALVIFSVFSTIQLFFYNGIGDIVDMAACEKKGCYSYCEAKRINGKNSKVKNICFATKPLLLILILILDIVLATCYISIVSQFEYMIDDGCLDPYVSAAIGYNIIYDPNLYNVALIYAAIGLNTTQLVFDQNVYVFIKSIILLIFCQYKKVFQKCKKENQVVQQSINTQNKNTAESEKLKDSQKDKIDIEAQKTNVNISPVVHNTLFGAIESKLPDLEKEVNKVDLEKQENKLSAEQKERRDDEEKEVNLDKIISLGVKNQIQKQSIFKKLNFGVKLEKLKKFNSQEDSKLKKEPTLKEIKQQKKKEMKIKKQEQKNEKKNHKKVDNKVKFEEGDEDYEDVFDDDIFKADNIKGHNQKDDIFREHNNQGGQDNIQDQIKYVNKRSIEMVQPPEAPAPPEQSEQQNNSIIDIHDDFF